MTQHEIVKMASEVITDCPLNQFFQWVPKRSTTSLMLVSRIWREDKFEAAALDHLRRSFERTLFSMLRGELADVADSTTFRRQDRAGRICIAGREAYEPKAVHDPYPLRANTDKIYDAIPDHIEVPKMGGVMLAPVWTQAQFEFVLIPQAFVVDEEDVLMGAKIAATLNSEAGRKSVMLGVSLPEHTPGEVSYEVFRRRVKR
jgi:hypothetical protein